MAPLMAQVDSEVGKIAHAGGTSSCRLSDEEKLGFPASGQDNKLSRFHKFVDRSATNTKYGVAYAKTPKSSLF